MKDDIKCKAIQGNGHQCIRPAILKGYCTKHFQKYHCKNKRQGMWKPRI